MSQRLSHRVVVIVAAWACLLSGASACAQTPTAQESEQSVLRIVGTDTMKDLMQRWIAGFEAQHPGAHIELTAKGALTAAPALAKGTADLAPLGREFTPSELAVFRSTHPYDPTAVPVALGSYDISGKTVELAFFVNEKNPIEHITFQQLDAIYCTTLRRDAKKPIATWGELGVRGELAQQEVHPIGVNFPDGISNFIRLGVCKDGEFRAGIREEHTGGAINVLDRIVSDVAADVASIGYAGFENLKPGSKLVAVSEDGGPALSGSREDVASARYPLTRRIYIFVDQAPGQPLSPVKRAFLAYVTSPEGQALVATDGVYMPLPAAEAAAAQKGIR